MKCRLKKGQERFQVVDGPLAGRSYKPGVEYDETEIPAGDRKKFEKVPEHAKAAPTATKKGANKS
ncbi:MAG: hypothetical protein OEY01_10700 [Desulfobulbaceae bacterium]|nr:hypothetical protein [Desulfobulbaceae bacterium]